MLEYKLLFLRCLWGFDIADERYDWMKTFFVNSGWGGDQQAEGEN